MGRAQGRPFSEKMRFWRRPGLHFASLSGAVALHFGAVGAYLGAVAPLGRHGGELLDATIGRYVFYEF